MAIIYPLALPNHTGLATIDFTATNAVAYSMSPFTFKGQTHEYTGQMMQADVTLPPMRRAVAEQWVGFLLSLRGQVGTFLLGDPLGAVPRGTVTSCIVTGNAGANTVSATVPIGETLLMGDYIQLGTRLHKVVMDYTGTGAPADLEIWPSLRETNTAVAAALTDCTGVFRLSSNQTDWSINSASFYGISFGAREAL